jgi:tetratricopeptide (TPR) repeat protein
MRFPMKGRDGEAGEDFGYGEGSRYAAHLDRGWSMLDRGDHEAARRAAESAQSARPEDPDAVVLLGAIALAEGDAAESLRCYDRAIELDPEYLEPYAAAAQVCLLDIDDPPRALRYCDEALEIEGLSPFEVLDVQLLATECELAGDRVEAARMRLDSIDERPFQAALDLLGEDEDDEDDELEIDLGTERGAALAFLRTDADGEPLDEEDRSDRTGRVLGLGLRLGRLRLDVDDGPGALRILSRVAERFGTEPDAWHLLSEAAHRIGDLRGAAAAGVRTLELDAQMTPPDWVPSPAIVHRRALRALSECGDDGVASLVRGDAPVAIVVREAPPAELVLEGVDPRITALTLAARAEGDDEPPSLVGVAVYRTNLARFARDAQNFEQELRLSVLDEVTAFLGLSDRRRDALGLPPLPLSMREPPPEPDPVPEPEPPKKRDRGRRRRPSTPKPG